MTEKDYILKDVSWGLQMGFIVYLFTLGWIITFLMIAGIALGYVMYVYVMKRRAYHKAKGETHYEEWKRKPKTLIRGAIAYLYDAVILNWIIFSIWFRRIPTEILATKRFHNILVNAPMDSWRFDHAMRFCKLLSKSDPDHCNYEDAMKKRGFIV